MGLFRQKKPKDSSGKTLNHLNVGTGQELTIKELANKIAEITKFEGKIIWDPSKPDGTPRKILDVKRINDLGWKSKIDLDTGLRKTIEKLNINILESQ